MMDRVGGFDWDAGNWPKCGKHSVSRAAIEEVFRSSPLIMPDRYPADKEARFNAVGRNAHGRHVFIVFTIRTIAGQRLVRPISARYMHQKEIDHYERQTGDEA